MALSGVPTAVFHVRNRTLILVVSPLILILTTTRIVANLRSCDPWLNWLAGLILWSILLTLALRQRLVLGEQGLDYTTFLNTIHIPWAQVTRINSRRTLWIWQFEGLEAWTLSPRPKDIFIDLTQFSRSWRQGPIGAILRSRAPHLFPRPAAAPDAD